MSYDNWKTKSPDDDRDEFEPAPELKIRTSHIFPPIPTRAFDWCAFYDGEEERSHNGYGATEQEAIADLLENYPQE